MTHFRERPSAENGVSESTMLALIGYLYVPWVVSNHFRREADGSKWDPQPCELILPSK
jgi:hypothetical protein